MIALVPASHAHWGIEDDIAGHFRSYDRGQIRNLATSSGYTIKQVGSLTSKLSNILFPAYNFLVRRGESYKLKLSIDKRTRLSGIREVNIKTRFPASFKVFLNRTALYPFYWLQKMSLSSESALVL